MPDEETLQLIDCSDNTTVSDDETLQLATSIVVAVLKLPQRIKGVVGASSTVDVHSLAAYRMLLALSVLYDVLHDYLPYAEEFLSDDVRVSVCVRVRALCAAGVFTGAKPGAATCDVAVGSG